MPEPAENQTVSQTWFWAVFSAVLVLLTFLEFQRLRTAVADGFDWLVCLSFWDIETTIPFVLMVALPVAFLSHRRRVGISQPTSLRTSSPQSDSEVRPAVSGKHWLICVGLFALTILSSYRIGSWPIDLEFRGQSTAVSFAELPPAYHDEFSYMLQAATFRQGRLSFPPAEVRPDLFHQFHVQNERRTVSRYFPLTGGWIALAISFGEPIYGHWVAGGLVTVFFYLSLLRIVTSRIALFAGLLIAVSPGIAIFSNLLLAHHPTLLALSSFTYCFLRMDESRGLRWAFAAGFALTLAMLGRPMTAAGYALPYGVLLCRQMISDSNSRTLAMGFVLPIGLGFAMLAIQNHDATGSAWKSPYQSYTDKFTPKHRYGFNNAVDTPPPEGPPAVAAYNNWAGNLTPAKAIQNVWNRLKASAQWSLASMPILFGVLMCMPQFFVQRAQKNCTPPRYLRLIAYSILSLHFVHVPYWFDGILHWHYVFETAPLLLILTAVGLSSTATLLARKIGRIGIAWVAALVLSGLIPSWFQLSAFQDTSRVSAAISEQAYSRTRMEFFIRLVTAPGISKPALVMVDELGTDPQLSYIINPPDYKAKVLTCRLPSSNLEVKELQQHYPDRTLYVFDPKTFKIRPWTAANIDTDEFD